MQVNFSYFFFKIETNIKNKIINNNKKKINK